MSDEYLWDRSGEADQEIERLERLLAPLRYERPLRKRMRPARVGPRRWLAACAAVILLVVIAAAVAMTLRLRWEPERPWDVLRVDGAVAIDGEPASERSTLAAGAELRTGEASTARVRVARIGDIVIGPSTVVRLQWTTSRRHRVALEKGSISARIWAPPFAFAVQTSSGVASDLGCEFDLHVGDAGGRITVRSGWVDFDGRTRSSLIPEGATAELYANDPGTPYYLDAPQPLVAAVRAYDRDGDAKTLERVVQAARPRDVMTLLHILERAPADQRPEVFRRASELAPPPRGVTIERVLARDHSAVSEWREAIGLRGIKKWWLNWRDVLPR